MPSLNQTRAATREFADPQQFTWDESGVECRLERLSQLAKKAHARGDHTRYRQLMEPIVYIRRVQDAEQNDLLTTDRAARIRGLWLSGRSLDEYRLDGPGVPKWIKQQRQALTDGAHARRMVQVHQARQSRLAPGRTLLTAGTLQTGGRSEHRSRERRPSAPRRVARSAGARGDPSEPPLDPFQAECVAWGEIVLEALGEGQL
jgi:hypothetical protein